MASTFTVKAKSLAVPGPAVVLPAKPPAASNPLAAALDEPDELCAALSCVDGLLDGLMADAPEPASDEAEVEAEAEADEALAEPAAISVAVATAPAPAAAKPKVRLNKGFPSARLELSRASASVRSDAPLPQPVTHVAERKPFAKPALAKLVPHGTAAFSAPPLAAAPPAAAPKRLPTSFALFSADRRPVLKAARPELAVAELTKAVAEEWKAVDPETKLAYEARATAAKTLAPPPPKAPKAPKAKAPKGEPAAKKPRTVTAWDAFNKARRVGVVAENPGASFGDIGKKLGEEWKSLTEADKAPYAAAAAAAGPVAAKPTKASKKRKSPAAAEEEEGVTEPGLGDEMDISAAPAAAAAAACDYEWGTDRGAAVTALLCRLRGGGGYVALRAPGGVPTVEAPLGSGGPAIAGLDHSEEQEQELAASLAGFKAALAARSDRVGGVDLDGLDAASPLGAMLLLEALRSPQGPLAKAAVKGGKNLCLGVPDVLITLPAVGLSFIVDRLVRTAVASARATAPPPKSAAPAVEAMAVEE